MTTFLTPQPPTDPRPDLRPDLRSNPRAAALAAIRASGLRPPIQLAARNLLDQADRQGCCWLELDDIKRLCGDVNLDTVRRYLTKLRDHDIIAFDLRKWAHVAFTADGAAYGAAPAQPLPRPSTPRNAQPARADVQSQRTNDQPARQNDDHTHREGESTRLDALRAQVDADRKFLAAHPLSLDAELAQVDALQSLLNLQRLRLHAQRTHADDQPTRQDREITRQDREITRQDHEITRQDHEITRQDRAITRQNAPQTRADDHPARQDRAITRQYRAITRPDRALPHTRARCLFVCMDPLPPSSEEKTNKQTNTPERTGDSATREAGDNDARPGSNTPSATQAPATPPTPAISKQEQRRSVKLLTDPEVDVHPNKAYDLAGQYSFADLLLHVLAYRRDLANNTVNGVGALIYRIEHDFGKSVFPQDRDTALWRRHVPVDLHLPGITEAFAAADPNSEEARRHKYIPPEYADIILG